MKNEETGWFLHQHNSALASLAEYKEVKIQPLEAFRVTGALIAEGCAAASLLSVLVQSQFLTVHAGWLSCAAAHLGMALGAALGCNGFPRGTFQVFN